MTMRILSLPRFLLVLVSLWSGTEKGTVNAFVSDTSSTRRHRPAFVLNSVPTPLDTLTSGLASICRLPKGVTVVPERKENDDIAALVLFDVDNSFDCRLVRERCSELDLVVTVVPAPSNSHIFDDDDDDSTSLYNISSATWIPALQVTRNQGETTLLEGKDDILSFLNDAFSTESADSASVGSAGDDATKEIKDEVLDVLLKVGGYIAGLLRTGRGTRVASCVSTTNRPSEPLVLYNYEGNQFCRLVREVLTELDLPYELRSAGKESPRRQELAGITGGSSQCPFLIDPNTGTQMPESADIVRYLYKTYALYTPPPEILQFASDKILQVAKPLLNGIAKKQAGDGQPGYTTALEDAKNSIEEEITANDVVVYTYSLSPFCTEAVRVLEETGKPFQEVSLGLEWIPGLITDEGASKRAALLELYGQSSLPHVFVNGKSIGGLYSGTPGLLSAIEQGELL